MATTLTAPQELVTIERPEFQGAPSWPERARSLKIVDPQTLQLASDERAGAKDLITKAHATFDPICASAHATWQVALRQRSTVIDPLESAVKIYDGSMLAFDAEQKRIAREAQRLADEAARRLAEEEREREVEHAETMGATVTEVVAIIDRPIIAQPVIAPAPPKAVGSVVKEKWQAEITDKRVLVEYIVANKRWELLGLLTPDTVALNAIARSVKSAGAIDGLKIWDAGSVASTPRRP